MTKEAQFAFFKTSLMKSAKELAAIEEKKDYSVLETTQPMSFILQRRLVVQENKPFIDLGEWPNADNWNR